MQSRNRLMTRTLRETDRKIHNLMLHLGSVDCSSERKPIREKQGLNHLFGFYNGSLYIYHKQRRRKRVI